MDFTKLPGKEVVEKTAKALTESGISVYVAKDREDAKKKVLEMIPKEAEVMTMTSVTLDTLGIMKEIEESGKFNAVKKKLYAMDRKTQGREMQRLGAAPEWAVGSAHAVTQDGKVMIASNSGSQLPAYAYGSSHVVWVVGTHKIVKDLDEGFKRVYEHSLPLESERAKKAYGVPGSNVSKLLIVNKELVPNRLHLIFVPEVVGF